jgi:hypothetical protein
VGHLPPLWFNLWKSSDDWTETCCNIWSSAFCQHSAFMRFLCISLYSTNRFVSNVDGVFSVRQELLTWSKPARGRAEDQAVSRRAVNAEAWFQSQVNPCEISARQNGTGACFCPEEFGLSCRHDFTRAVHHLNDTLSRRNRQSQGNLPNSSVLLEIEEHRIEKYFLEVARG